MNHNLPRLGQPTVEMLIQSYVLGRRNIWSVLKASGSGIRDYLQGQITQDMAKLSEDQGIHACILTPQGKAVSELYIIEGRNDELILLTPGVLAEVTVARLRRFALGAELRMGVVDSMGICSVQGANAAEALADFGLSEPGQSWLATSRHESEDIFALTMPNDPHGFWVVAPNERVDAVLDASSAVVDENEIEAMRIIQGLPRFGVEWQSTLQPLNANLEEFHGVSFDKGCYVGQEITSRMHWRGGIRKKLYKVMIQGNVNTIKSLPCPLFASAEQGSVRMGELCSAAIDHEGTVHGIALLPIEVAEETGRELFVDAETSVYIKEACHA